MKNSMISDKAAVYAISKEDALTRLSAEYQSMMPCLRRNALARPAVYAWQCRSCGSWTCT